MLWKVKYALIGLAAGALSAYRDRLSDETYTHLRYILHFERLPRYRNPRSFYDRLNALKLYEKDPLRARIADKLAAREFVRERFGDKYLTRLHRTWPSADHVSFEGLPRQFVLKANHGSGMVKVVTDRDAENVDAVRRLCERWLRTDYSALEKEWVYRDIPRRVFAEEYLTDGTTFVPLDYRFLVLFGRCAVIQVDRDRFSDHHTRAVFDRDFNELPYSFGHPRAEGLAKPPNLGEMVAVAETLGREFSSFIRVDLYSVNGRIYFSELTNFPQAGFGRMDEGLDRLLDSHWREGEVRSRVHPPSREP